ncbi:dihydrolipoyl dehydrogenase family protein [Comamonas testosteroni]|uniref:Mercuric reductase n=1 Tax=Comamonas testosteroni TaxID=285 RepID=A0A096GRV7_COMTE|nr:FAD-dependent oxidoreductase [Comamonas testosteroni]KGH27920.1 hypothetical protein P353_16800 [Comamonas testosteroni]
MKRFDLIVIGAGAGGLNSARAAVALGKQVALIERYKPGGECTWAGCIPSKALIQMAKDITVARKFADIAVDSRAVMRKVRELIESAHQGESVSTLIDAGIHYVQGDARFINANCVDVDGQRIEADAVILATGSSAAIPAIPGIDSVAYLTNESIFQLDKLPKSLVVLGGGAIGVELSQALQRLGVGVTLVERANSLLPREDGELADIVSQQLVADGVCIRTSSTATQITEEGTGVLVRMDSPNGSTEVRAEALLVALGRRANVGAINLEAVGVEHNEQGICVDEFCQTSVPNIYAVGDVVGPYLFSHTAGHQARQVIRNLYGKVLEPVCMDGVAWCTFSEPEFARSGLTEEQARQKRGDGVEVFVASYEDLDRAVVDQKTVGRAKVICDAQGFLLGASIVGERACELLGELQVMQQHAVPLQSLARTIHPYPGYSELLFSLGLDAAERIPT